MPWTRPTLDEIKTRMESDMNSRLTGGTPLLRFSVLKVLITAVAGMIHILHGFIAFLARQLLPTTSEDSWLDDQASSWGLSRIAASFASGTLALTGANGNVIPLGTVYLSALGVEYLTQAPVTVSGGAATVSLVARTAGLTGNLPVGTTLTAQAPVPGVGDAGTSSAITGGVEKESNEALRERILARIRNPPAGGSESDYLAWARAVAGVERAWVFGNYYGFGTVAVVISATGSNPVPSGGLVTSVAAYIEPLRPVTAAVTVSPIVSSIVDISIDLTPMIPEITDLIEANLRDLFESESAPGGTLYLSHLQRAIASSGVLDYAINTIAVDSMAVPTENYVFPGFKYGILDTVSFHDL